MMEAMSYLHEPHRALQSDEESLSYMLFQFNSLKLHQESLDWIL